VQSSSRNTKTQPLEEALTSFLRTYNLQTKFDESYLVAFWEKFMGKTIASRTEKIYIRQGVLFLKISSASLKQDLLMSKTRMIELLNQESGKNLVHDIVFL
jgi:predicted nucleic acid-binding Zn ribbon protein